jgi:hypothetical protein
MHHVWGSGEMHTEFWWGNTKWRDHLEDLDMGGKIILNGFYGNGMRGCGVWTGLMWLGVMGVGGLL